MRLINSHAAGQPLCLLDFRNIRFHFFKTYMHGPILNKHLSKIGETTRIFAYLGEPTRSFPVLAGLSVFASSVSARTAFGFLKLKVKVPLIESK